MSTQAQKLVHHFIASQLQDHQVPIEDGTGADSHFFIDALEHSTKAGDLVALVDRWWQQQAVAS